MANRRITKDTSDNVIAGAVLGSFPLNKLDRILEWASIATVTVKGSNFIPMRIGGNWFIIDTDTIVSTAINMDTGVIASGRDYYVYACDSAGLLVFKISLNATCPLGFTADNSRKIGGFHTLGASVGTIAGHALTGYLANDILPASVWDLKHRAGNAVNVGLAYDGSLQKWYQVYLASDDGIGGVQSVNGATILDTLNWMDSTDRGGKVGMELLEDGEFQVAFRGGNERTNIFGSADPVTTGGHSDTAGRRMISDIGLEDGAGAMWQWLKDQSTRWDGVVGWHWLVLPGAKGSIHIGTSTADVKLLAGGCWADAAVCGSRGRLADNARWFALASIGARFGVRRL